MILSLGCRCRRNGARTQGHCASARAALLVGAAQRVLRDNTVCIPHCSQTNETLLFVDLHCAGDALILTDDVGIITSVNEAAVKLSGYSREGIDGLAMQSLLSSCAKIITANFVALSRMFLCYRIASDECFRACPTRCARTARPAD